MTHVWGFPFWGALVKERLVGGVSPQVEELAFVSSTVEGKAFVFLLLAKHNAMGLVRGKSFLRVI